MYGIVAYERPRLPICPDIRQCSQFDGVYTKLLFTRQVGYMR